MIRISTLFSLLLVSIFSLINVEAHSTVYVDNGTSTSYNLNNNDSLYIQSGTFTGSINNWMGAPKITVAANATFNPSGFGYFLGSIIVYGKATLPRIDGQTTNFSLTNYGRITVSSTTYIANGKLSNMYGATITFTGAFSTNTGTIVNKGTMLANSSFYAGASSVVTNSNTLTSIGYMEINGSHMTNGGKMSSGGKMIFSGTTFTNSCRTAAEGTIEISSSTIYNNGLFWASAAQNNSKIINSGTIINSGGNSVIKAVNFENSGTINGSATLYLTGTTKSGGVVGRAGTTTDTIRVYDATRSNPATIFDEQSGSVYPNVVFNTMTAPDTTSIYGSCSSEMASTVLPVKWNYFYANLSNNIPALTWSAEMDNATNFEIERSYDGANFSSVAFVMSAATSSEYKYNDQLVNTQAKVVYYRIKAIEPSGAQKYSDVRAVRFSNTQNITVQTTPNPFTSQFTIGYQSTTKETISIRIVSVTGQVLISRTASVNSGYNSITITEGAQLNKGVYLVQLISQRTVISSEKIMKQ